MLSDSTQVTIQYWELKDKYLMAIELCNEWRSSGQKGSLTLYFDGSGRIPRVTRTIES